MTLTADPLRVQHHGLTGIYVFATLDGRRAPYDIAELTPDSLLAWLRRDGGDNRLAENCIGIMLGHGHLHPGAAG